MTPEFSSNNLNGPDILNSASGTARHWFQIAPYLPEGFSKRLEDNPYKHVKKFVRDYFRAQVKVAQGHLKEGKEIIDGLDKRRGFKNFEEANQRLFAAIEMAVRGETKRVDEAKVPVVPSFNKIKLPKD